MHLTHFFKELVDTVTAPLAFGMLIALGGAIVRVLGWRRISNGLWVAAALLVYLSATSPVADALLIPLEARYAPLGELRNLPSVRYIVVLGSGYSPRTDIPITAALALDGLARISEGIRILRQVRGALLVVSGGASDNETPSAMGYAKLAVDLGVDADAIVKLEKPLDTAEEATSVAALVGNLPFILVTSAYHMPRAMRLMQRAGANPIPAPTGQLAPREVRFEPRGWIPRSSSVHKTERALHEYMGLAIAR
jgi:uncharacterized SAM-binding protein YcdF (DUF218 family)